VLQHVVRAGPRLIYFIDDVEGSQVGH
jgi:hypothetical protein